MNQVWLEFAGQTLDFVRSHPEAWMTVVHPEDRALNVNEMELVVDLLQIAGDRVQLQQVAMNLIVNSIEALKELDGMREIIIQSQRAKNEQVLVSFTDTGIGFHLN